MPENDRYTAAEPGWDRPFRLQNYEDFRALPSGGLNVFRVTGTNVKLRPNLFLHRGLEKFQDCIALYHNRLRETMRILYIFPHPDDESFGPAAVMHRQLQAGHEVHLLTLTRGGATKERLRLGLGIEEMGAVRHEEMQAVQRTLGLSGMTVLDYPDSGLKQLDPRILEQAIEHHVEALRPDVLVTYAVHGVSGFHDHLVTHAVVKRLYCDLRDRGHRYLRRLALLTVPDSGEPTFGAHGIRLKHSLPDEIGCTVALREEDREMMKACLRCYATYQQTIEDSGVIEKVGDAVHFELFGERHAPPLGDLFAGL